MDVVSPAADHVDDAKFRNRIPSREHHSDKDTLAVNTDPQIVMAEQITHDVVKEAQSMGSPAPIDDTATSTNYPAGNGAPIADSTPSDTTSTNATKEVERSEEDRAAGQTDEDPTQSVPSATSEAKEQLTNGDSGEQSASEDVAASGGSDTDISRPGSVDPTKERPAGHLRSNSLKKPASFKSVSVTKNFLAKSAVSTPVPGPGVKAPPAGQTSGPTLQTMKPRLVAKSGSGIGNVSRAGLKVNGAGTGPDASKVWNKNQPVAPPPPKQFTDEELKQQYGIHLATRLQADDSSKEAKWADIDDDEDDWAPETVQWMDGTKSSVAPVENEPPPPEEPKPITKNETSAEPPKATPVPATSTQRPSATSGVKTILKPGAHAQTSSTKSGLVLKGQPEKATLVSKPSGPTPVKSPWAALPPVDKASPVPINPPAQQPPSRFSQQDSRGYDAIPPPHLPAKEIAPDDFNRSWRDDRGSRELFNSHSGRYEPVNDMRRGSVRDSYRQQPAVLQRPSQDGPAEPSAAFQTSRTSADAPTWGRRRNSSNLSGGSGRRMSIDRHHIPDLPPMPMNVQRRGSHSINGAEAVSPASPRLAFSQKGPQGDVNHSLMTEQHTWTQKSSPNLSNVQPASPFGSVASIGPQENAAPPVPAQTEDPVEVQKRMMAEKIERARLHKQKEREQEAQQEAERKERLRKKLEAMGLAEEAKSKSKEPSPARPAIKSPQKDKAVPAPVQSPPKPPVPTAEGEVAQYGMMKVHQPHPVKKPVHAEATSKSVPKSSPSPVKAQNEGHPKPAPSLTEAAPQSSGAFARDSKTNKSPSDNLQTHPQPSSGDARTHSQISKPTQPQPAGWSSTSLTQQSRPWGSNVWGPPQARDRALGNGTFDSAYNPAQSRPSPPQLPSQSQAGQAPTLGLNPPLKPSSSQTQGLHAQPFSQQALYAQAESMPAQQPTAASKPGPIGPPAAKGWGDFRNAISLDDKAMVVKAKQELERLGGETFRPEIRETYTDQQGRSQKTVHSKVGGNAALAQNDVKPEGPQTIAPELKPKEETQAPIGQGAHLQTTGPAARSSRFFPRPSETAPQPPVTTSKSDSPPPPPPETESHPAFIGDSGHPIVKMPKPSPRVRLPPAVTEANAPAEAPVTMPIRGPRIGIGARPLALNPEWQARFNSLLDKTAPAAPVPAPMGKPADTAQSTVQAKPGAVTSSSKAPLEVRSNLASATVSLPNAPARKMFVDDGSSEVTTKLSAEEILLEEREFGSLPIVKVSKVPHLAANEPPVGFPRAPPRWQKPMDTTTKPTLHILDFDRSANTIDVRIRLANMREAIIKAVAKKPQHNRGPAHKGPKRNFSSNNGGPSTSGPNQRPQRKSSNYQGQGSGSNPNSSPRPSGGNAWGSSRSTPPNNNTGHNAATWTRRAAPVH